MPRPSLQQVYLNRRMAVLLGLGFASGLPSVYKLLGDTLKAWLLDYRIDIRTVGLMGLVTLPLALNFLWAPLLDRLSPPVFAALGRRRGWLLLIQLLVIGGIVAVALTGPTHEGQSLWPLGIAAVVLAFLVASQDVVADAYRTDVLGDAELGSGAAVYVNGYRLAMLAAGGGAMMLAGYVSWRGVYFLLAALMSVGVLATLCAPPPPHADPPENLAKAVVEPVRDFFARTGTAGPAILLFVVLFKLPDALANAMVVPLLRDGLKMNLQDIGLVREWLGIAMVILGAFVGGAVLAKMALKPALLLLAVLQAVSNFGYCVLAATKPGLGALAAVVVIESLCAGAVTAGLIACLMSLCNRRYSATQYALFSSLNFFTGALVGSLTGFLVARIGYAGFFAWTVAAGLPGVALLLLLPGKMLQVRR